MLTVGYSINSKYTLTGLYSNTHSTAENQGIGGFNLQSRASTSDSNQHNIQLTESAILNTRTVNETRFQYEINDRDSHGDNSIPAINVSSAFYGGGSQVGTSFNRSHRWELQD